MATVGPMGEVKTWFRLERGERDGQIDHGT